MLCAPVHFISDSPYKTNRVASKSLHRRWLCAGLSRCSGRRRCLTGRRDTLSDRNTNKVIRFGPPQISMLPPAAGALAAAAVYPLADRAADAVGVAMGRNGIFLWVARFHSGLSI